MTQQVLTKMATYLTTCPHTVSLLGFWDCWMKLGRPVPSRLNPSIVDRCKVDPSANNVISWCCGVPLLPSSDMVKGPTTRALSRGHVQLHSNALSSIFPGGETTCVVLWPLSSATLTLDAPPQQGAPTPSTSTLTTPGLSSVATEYIEWIWLHDDLYYMALVPSHSCGWLL